MSPDGSTFALPRSPVLVSGPDVLHDKRIIHVSSADVFWTHDFVFVRDSPRGLFRILRISDLARVGSLQVQKDRLVNGIFECSNTLYLASIDDADEDFFEPITHPLFKAQTTLRYRNAPDAARAFTSCTLPIWKADFSGVTRVTEVVLFEPLRQITIDIAQSNLTLSEFLPSKDNALLLTGQSGEPLGSNNPGRVVVLKVTE
jgi:hypothetical protein